MTKPDVTVAIPTLNRTDLLISTIQQVLKQSYKNIELIVVNQTKELPRKFLDEIDSIQDKDRRLHHYIVDPASGTAAKNYALVLAKAPLIIFLDDDVELDKNLVKMFLEVYAEHPEVSAIGGRVLQEGFPIKKEFLKFDEYGISHGVFTSPESGYTNAFAGGNCMLKVNEALRVGGFDTRYYKTAFREESDMSLKMTRASMRIYYDPRPTLTHLAVSYGGTRIQGNIKDSKNFYANEMFFTIRAVKLGNLMKALSLKRKEYTDVVGRRYKLKRNILFFYGLLAAIKRLVFDKQIISVERKV